MGAGMVGAAAQLAGQFFQGDRVLHVVAVATDEHQVVPDDRRAGRAVMLVVRQARRHTMSPAVVRQAVPCEPKWTNTCWPSITGVGEAWLFLLLMRPRSGERKTSTSWTISPLPRSRHTARSEPSRSMAVVSQICSPATTGDDQPSPAIGFFQRTFSVSLHWCGIPAASACPWPSGPRNCGQSPAAATRRSTPQGPTSAPSGREKNATKTS